MLTKKQHDLLLFIDDTIKSRGYSPSFDEMRDHMGLKSKSGIHRLVDALEKRHAIRRLPNKARAIEVTYTILPAQKPSFMQPVCHDTSYEIPLYGKIAAGLPIEAVAQNETVFVPPQMTGVGEHYALIVEGDSMKDAGIMDGDTVVIRRTHRAPDGSIVVALVDGYEVTLKRLHTRGRTIALEPANPAYETRIFDADRIEIQGVLVGLMRQY